MRKIEVVHGWCVIRIAAVTLVILLFSAISLAQANFDTGSVSFIRSDLRDNHSGDITFTRAAGDISFIRDAADDPTPWGDIMRLLVDNSDFGEIVAARSDSQVGIYLTVTGTSPFGITISSVSLDEVELFIKNLEELALSDKICLISFLTSRPDLSSSAFLSPLVGYSPTITNLFLNLHHPQEHITPILVTSIADGIPVVTVTGGGSNRKSLYVLHPQFAIQPEYIPLPEATTMAGTPSSERATVGSCNSRSRYVLDLLYAIQRGHASSCYGYHCQSGFGALETVTSGTNRRSQYVTYTFPQMELLL